jgi:hypothetical protein
VTAVSLDRAALVYTYNDINPALSRRDIRRDDIPRLVPLDDLVCGHGGVMCCGFVLSGDGTGSVGR